MGPVSRLAIGAVCGFAALAMSNGHAQAYCRAGIDTGPDPCIETAEPRLFWSRSCVSYAFHDKAFERLPAFDELQVRNIASASFDAWSTVDCGRPPFYVQQLSDITDTEPVGFSLDVPNEFVLSVLTPDEWSGLDGVSNGAVAFAITFLWHNKNTGEIYDVDMALNLSLGDFGRCDQPCTDGTIDLQNTLTHEAGHVYGLGHSNVRDATMHPDATPGANFMRTLTPDDEAGLCALDLPSHECSGGAGCTCPPPGPLNGRTVRSSGCSTSPRRADGAVFPSFLLLSLALLMRAGATCRSSSRRRDKRPRAAKSPNLAL